MRRVVKFVIGRTIFILMGLGGAVLVHRMHLSIKSFSSLDGWLSLESCALYCQRVAPRNSRLCRSIIWSFSVPFTFMLFLWGCASVNEVGVVHPSDRLMGVAGRFARLMSDPTGELRLLLAGLLFVGGVKIVIFTLEGVFGIAGNPLGWPEALVILMRRSGFGVPRQGPAMCLYRLIILLGAKGFFACAGVIASYSAIDILSSYRHEASTQCLLLPVAVTVISIMVAGIGCLLVHLYIIFGNSVGAYFPEVASALLSVTRQFGGSLFFAGRAGSIQERTILKQTIVFLVRFFIRNRADRDQVWHRLTTPLGPQASEAHR